MPGRVLGLVAVLVLAGLYGGLASYLAGRVASNVTVSGVSVGGMSPRDATATLERALAGPAARPLQLSVPSRSFDIRPGEAGLDLDIDSTVAGLTGFTVNPVRMWSHLTGTGTHSLMLRVDRSKLMAAVSRAARTLDRPVKEGSVTFADGQATEISSVAGTRVNVPETADAMAVDWPRRQAVPAVTTTTAPNVSEAEIRRATKEFAVPAMSAPVILQAGGATVILRPRQYGPALSTAADAAGRLHLKINTPRLMAAVGAAAPGLERPPVDASVRLAAGRPRVVPAVVGTKFDPAAATAQFRVALSSPSRTVRLTSVTAQPAVTTATATAWQIKEPISTFTTGFPVSVPRTNNIKIAAAALDGTIIRPGKQFSLNTALGERTPAKGYAKAPVIYDGRLVNDYGGGVSQVSTTIFNAAFLAGVRIDQHTPHSFFIPRYPEGRDATVSWPDVDQKWTNDTGSGILVQARVKGDSITVTLWGTKVWDVAAVKGARRNVVKPKTIVDARPTCVPQLPTPGFDVTVAQVFKKNGAQVRVVPFKTHYIPEDSVKCTHPSLSKRP